MRSLQLHLPLELLRPLYNVCDALALALAAPLLSIELGSISIPCKVLRLPTSLCLASPLSLGAAPSCGMVTQSLKALGGLRKLSGLHLEGDEATVNGLNYSRTAQMTIS